MTIFVQDMIDAGVATFLKEHVSKDSFGSTYEENKSFGHKFSNDIDYPD